MAPPEIEIESGVSTNPMNMPKNAIDNKEKKILGLDADDEDEDDASEVEVTPLPYLQIVAAFSLQFTEALNVTTLFPYMAFMVEDFGFESGKSLGIHVGLLAASFCTAQFFSAYFWAMAADRYGRKPILFLGTFLSRAIFARMRRTIIVSCSGGGIYE